MPTAETRMERQSVEKLRGRRIIYAALAAICALAAWGLYCYHNYQFWTHVDTSGFESLVEFHGDCIQAHRGRQILVHREFLPFLERIADYAAKAEINLVITNSCGNPLQELQGEVVPPAKKSNHLAGHAIDVNVRQKGITYTSSELARDNFDRLPASVKEFIQRLRDDSRIRWGGDFRRQDPVHIDDEWNRLHPAKWQKQVDGCRRDFAGARP